MKMLRSFAIVPLSIFLSTAVFAADARIASPKGDVKVSPAASGELRAAADGETLPPGARVSTGPDSSCEIVFGKSVVRVRPDSFARVVTVDPARVDITSGKLLAVVRNLPKGSSFQVGTPVAVASVRGTIFTASPDTFEAIEDDIVLEPSDGGPETVLEEGSGASFDAGVFEVSELPAEVIAEAKEEAREAESRSEGDGGDTGGAAADVLDQDQAGPAFGDTGDVSEARSESAELSNVKDRLDNTKGDDSDKNPNAGGSGTGGSSGGGSVI